MNPKQAAANGLPSGWVAAPIRQAIQPRVNRVRPTDHPKSRFIGMDHVEAHSTKIVGSRAASGMKSSALSFRAGDVLYGRLRPYLNKVAQPKFDGLASAEFIVFPDTQLLKSHFLKHRLNAADFVSFASHLNEGDRPRVNFSQLGDFNILIPPPLEQLRIVSKIEELLSELDKGVESLKTARAQLKVYRQAVLKHAFEGKLTAQWREENKDKLETAEQLLSRVRRERVARDQRQLRDWKTAINVWNEQGKPGNRPSKPRKAANLRSDPDALAMLPPLPVGHAYTFLANLGQLGRGKSKHRPRNAPALFGGPYPFIQTAEVKAAERIIREYTQTYSEIGLGQSMLWPQGTLCITIAANIAETAFLGFDGCFPDSVVGLTADEKLVLPEYVELFIKSVRTRIEAYAPATAQKNINLTTLESLVVPLCSVAEQRVLVDRLQAILTVIDGHRAIIDTQLRRADALRQSILKKAFSGELVEQGPNDEPATVLLERIKAEKASQKPRARTRQRKVANA